MTRATPPTAASDDEPVDGRLRAALRHAPDAGLVPPPALSEAILRQARATTQAAAAAAAPATRPATTKPRLSVWTLLSGTWEALSRPSLASGLASVMLASLVGVMWWGRVPDEDGGRGLPRVAEMKRDSAAEDLPAAAAASPASPEPAAPASPANVGEAATATAPAPREDDPLTSLPRARGASPESAKEKTMPGGAPRAKQAPPPPPPPSPHADVAEDKKKHLAEAESAGVAARQSLPAPQARNEVATQGLNNPPPAAAAPAPVAPPKPAPAPAGEPVIAAAPATPAPPRQDRLSELSKLAAPPPADAERRAMAPRAADTAAAAAAASPAAPQSASEALALSLAPAGSPGAAASSQAFRAAGQLKAVMMPPSPPLSTLRESLAQHPERWAWQRDGGSPQPVTPALLRWLLALEAATGPRWAAAPAPSAADAPPNATLRLLQDGRLAHTLALQAQGLRWQGHQAAAAAWFAALEPGAVQTLRLALPPATP
jgi:hypothetical protein